MELFACKGLMTPLETGCYVSIHLKSDIVIYLIPLHFNLRHNSVNDEKYDTKS